MRQSRHSPFVLTRKVSDAELARAAAESGGKRSELAARLGMSERTLYRRLKALTDAGKA